MESNEGANKPGQAAARQEVREGRSSGPGLVSRRQPLEILPRIILSLPGVPLTVPM